MKNRKKLYALLVAAGCTLTGYFLWLSLRPVEIIGVHEDGNFIDILVNHYTVTDRGKLTGG